MKVLLVNDYRDAGGAEVILGLTRDLLGERGHEVRVLCSEDLPSHRRTPLSYVHNRRACAALARVLGEFDPDVVHLHNIYHELSPAVLGPIARFKRTRATPPRVLLTAHDYHLVCPNPGLCGFARGERASLRPEDLPLGLIDMLLGAWDERSMPRSLLRGAQRVWNYSIRRRQRVLDRVVCPSRFMARVMERAGLPTLVLSNPAPAWDPPAPGARTVGEGAVLELLFAGRVEPEKGLSEFLRHAPLDRQWTLLVLGDGRDREACARVIASRPGMEQRVTMLGRQPRERTLELLGRAHALVLPSRWAENQPTVMLEALSRGASLMVADAGGMREIVDDSGVGVCFEPRSGLSIDAALDRLTGALHAGGLNRFDASAYLGERSPQRHIDQLVALYAGEQA